jgi:asparagine N-glycosylation enzyme membrane subunit Stt3
LFFGTIKTNNNNPLVGGRKENFMIDVGRWAFVIGILLAISAGFWTIPNLAFILVILGLIVGFLNITATEVETYLIGVIALLVIGATAIQALTAAGEFVGIIQAMINNVIAFVAASGLVVALRVILSLGQADD